MAATKEKSPEELLTEGAREAVDGLLGRDIEQERIAAILRRPFPPEQIGNLPRIWCKACRDASSKVCGQHKKERCDVCGNNMTTAHLHLSYVGHAAVTDRLLQADPGWSWEPMAVNEYGVPFLVTGQSGAMGEPLGLWIKLTVGGVTRPGYGDGKSIKECVGDAIRNAAMRFGVALDLWSKENLVDDQQDAEDQAGPDSGSEMPMEALLGQLGRWVEDARPWIAESARLLYGNEAMKAQTSGWPPMTAEQKQDLLERVSQTVKTLETVEGYAAWLTTEDGREQAQAAVQAAFQLAFDQDVKGPEEFAPAIPF